MKKQEFKGDKSAVLVKMAKFCSYQDRCQKEVREKLQELLPNVVDQEDVLNYLLEEKYLDEERYVRSVVRGRFFYKNWGRVKIIHYLKQNEVDSFLVEDVIAEEIKEEVYTEKIEGLVESKLQSTKGKSDFEIKQKILLSLYQKGFETNLVEYAITDVQSREA